MSKATESVDIGAGDPSRDIVRQVLAESWGAQAEPVPLGSVQDSVYWVLDHSGGPLGAVRVSTGAVDEEDVEAEGRRLAHLAEVFPELDLPRASLWHAPSWAAYRFRERGIKTHG